MMSSATTHTRITIKYMFSKPDFCEHAPQQPTNPTTSKIPPMIIIGTSTGWTLVLKQFCNCKYKYCEVCVTLYISTYTVTCVTLVHILQLVIHCTLVNHAQKWGILSTLIC